MTPFTVTSTTIESSSPEMNPDETKDPTCKELYGPYPKAVPIPFLSSTNEGREGETPSDEVIESAKSISDLPRDYRDVGTPDEWVTRDGRMVRLTGRHPFNSEPPLSLLASYNFITPSSLHIVRNHNRVPQLTWEDHTLVVGGPLVPNALELSMDELAAMPSKEFPVTISCCGNRRKEVNMIKQTIGFSWGAGGVGKSTARSS